MGVVVAAALLKPVAVALPLVGRDGLKPVVAESDLLTVACAEHDAAVAEHRYVHGLAGDHEVVAVEQPPAGKSDVERAATEERAMCRRGAAADLGDAALGQADSCHRAGPVPPKTVATLMDAAGLSSRRVADQLGHAEVSMTRDNYSGRKVARTGAAGVLELFSTTGGQSGVDLDEDAASGA
ncbi:MULTISPECIES: integrase [unclassified Pseudonocardia]|uniref:integrase n=1 Tax=unclassified Pseudonocardia TaxID=2619320 RepID=UPI0001FFE1DF